MIVFSRMDFVTVQNIQFVRTSNKCVLSALMIINVFALSVEFYKEHHDAKADNATKKLLKKTALNASNIADLNKDGKISFSEYEFFVSNSEV